MAADATSPSAVGAAWCCLALTAGLLWGGCATKPSAPPKSLPKPASKSPARPQPELAADVSTKALTQAIGHVREGRHDQAARSLERWLASYPRSPSTGDAHWWLGQAYEGQGRVAAALSEYRQAAAAVPGTDIGAQATRSIARLEQALAGVAADSDRPRAALVSPQAVPSGPGLSAWIEGVQRGGATALALPIGTDEKSGATQAGLWFASVWAPCVRDLFGDVVPAAHRNGLAVWAIVDARHMNWLDPRQGWHDWDYDPAARELRPSPRIDLSHPAFQEYMTGVLRDLAATGIDGILFRRESKTGPFAGVSEFAVRHFEQETGLRIEPTALQQGEQYAPDAWRWIGWKARTGYKIRDRWMQAVRAQHPAMKFGIELHATAVSDPVQALQWYGEDLLEAKRSRYDVVVLGDWAANGSLVVSDVAKSVEQAAALVGDARRVWVEWPEEGHVSRVWGERANEAARRLAGSPRVGLVLRMEAPPVP